MSIKQCIILNCSPIKNQFCDLYFRPTFKFSILSSNEHKDEEEEAAARRPFLDLRIFFFTTAPPPNFCAVIRLLQKFQMASKRRSCVYTLLLRLQTHTEVRIGLVLRTYHLHFSRQLFVQRIEYIALLLRRSPANSCRYDIIAMNYSKPVATKT